MDSEKDYYAVLGVSPFATDEEIKHAYYALARRYHPDSRNEDTPTSLFREVQEAYSVLADPPSRQGYDRERDELNGARGDGALTGDVLLSQQVLHSAHKVQVLYALLVVRPSTEAEGQSLPLDLAMVIDCSTSMRGARLRNIKEAARQIVDQLQDEDILTLTTFNDRAEVIFSDQVGASRARAKACITALQAEGGTEILQGLRLGLRGMEAHARESAVRHLVLLTDGRTYGDDAACLTAAERAGQRGIGITAMGIGEDWNEQLLDGIASRSGGSSAYIASPGQARSLLMGTVQGLESVYAKGLTLSLRSADGVRVESAFKVTPAFGRLEMCDGMSRLGVLPVNTPVQVLLELAVDRRPQGRHRLVKLKLRGDVPTLDRQGATLRLDVCCHFTSDGPAKTDGSVPPAVLSALRKITLYRMQEQAWSAWADGRREQASRQLERVATRLMAAGEARLARAAMLEARHIAEGNEPTEQGHKRIEYGTRRLCIGGDAYD